MDEAEKQVPSRKEAMRRSTVVVLLGVLASPRVGAQSPPATGPRAVFDIATARLNKSGEMRVSMRIIPGAAYEASM